MDTLTPHDLDAERQVLGACLMDKEAAETAMQILNPDDFYLSGHGEIFEAIVHSLAKNNATDMLCVTDYLRGKGCLEKIGGAVYVAGLSGQVASTAFVEQHAKIVENKSVARKVLSAVERVKAKAYSGEMSSPAELTAYAEAELSGIQIKTSHGGLEHVGQGLTGVIKDIENRKDSKSISGIPTGYPLLTAWLAGYQKGDLIIIAGRPSMGKAQPLDSKIRTLTGWKYMRDIDVGDELVSIDGRPSMVTGIYPQGSQQVYKVLFSDGRSTRCSGEHLWSVKSSRWYGYRVISTEELMKMLGQSRYQRRISVPLVSGDFGEDKNLPIDPWLLGVLIGNGNLTNGSPIVSTQDAQTLFAIQEVIGNEMMLSYIGGYDYRIRSVDGKCNDIMRSLRDFGLAGCVSDEKFIPSAYMKASKLSRIKILQGLLDTDGWVESFGSVRFSTSSEQLAKNVQELVRSLGGLCTVATKEPYYTYKGERRKGKTHYICNIRMENQELAFTLIRKKRRCTKTPNTALTIVSIVPDGIEPVQCIKVSHDSQLYVTDDYIVTHNTTFALQEAKDAAVKYGVKVAFFSLEMSRRQLIEKLLINQGMVSAQNVRTGMLNAYEWQKITQASVKLLDSGVYIDDSSKLTTIDIAQRCRRMQSKVGLDMVVIDYLGLVKPAKRSEKRYLEIGEITKDLKILAKELDIPVILLSQLSRDCESRQEKRPQLSDLRESGEIEQDADVVMFIYRDSMYNKQASENSAEIILAKQRNGPTGKFELVFIKEYTKFALLDKNHKEVKK